MSDLRFGPGALVDLPNTTIEDLLKRTEARLSRAELMMVLAKGEEFNIPGQLNPIVFNGFSLKDCKGSTLGLGILHNNFSGVVREDCTRYVKPLQPLQKKLWEGLPVFEDPDQGYANIDGPYVSKDKDSCLLREHFSSTWSLMRPSLEDLSEAIITGEIEPPESMRPWLYERFGNRLKKWRGLDLQRREGYSYEKRLVLFQRCDNERYNIAYGTSLVDGNSYTSLTDLDTRCYKLAADAPVDLHPDFAKFLVGKFGMVENQEVFPPGNPEGIPVRSLENATGIGLEVVRLGTAVRLCSDGVLCTQAKCAEDLVRYCKSEVDVLKIRRAKEKAEAWLLKAFGEEGVVTRSSPPAVGDVIPASDLRVGDCFTVDGCEPDKVYCVAAVHSDSIEMDRGWFYFHHTFRHALPPNTPGSL